MKQDHELHQDSRSWHLLGFLIEHGKDVALVVGDKAEPRPQQGLPTSLQEEVGQDQGSKHLQRCNAPGRVPILMGPGVVLEGNLVVEPPGVSLGRVLFASNPSTDVGFSRLGRTGVTRPPPFRQRIVGARLNLWMVKKVKQKLGKGSDQVAGPTHRGSGSLPGPKGLKERPTKGPGR